MRSPIHHGHEAIVSQVNMVKSLPRFAVNKDLVSYLDSLIGASRNLKQAYLIFKLDCNVLRYRIKSSHEYQDAFARLLQSIFTLNQKKDCLGQYCERLKHYSIYGLDALLRSLDECITELVQTSLRQFPQEIQEKTDTDKIFLSFLQNCVQVRNKYMIMTIHLEQGQTHYQDNNGCLHPVDKHFLSVIESCPLLNSPINRKAAIPPYIKIMSGKPSLVDDATLDQALEICIEYYVLNQMLPSSNLIANRVMSRWDKSLYKS
jgi:hypothetical protein